MIRNRIRDPRSLGSRQCIKKEPGESTLDKDLPVPLMRHDLME